MKFILKNITFYIHVKIVKQKWLFYYKFRDCVYTYFFNKNNFTWKKKWKMKDMISVNKQSFKKRQVWM